VLESPELLEESLSGTLLMALGKRTFFEEVFGNFPYGRSCSSGGEMDR